MGCGFIRAFNSLNSYRYELTENYILLAILVNMLNVILNGIESAISILNLEVKPIEKSFLGS